MDEQQLKCPACGADLVLESKDESMNEAQPQMPSPEDAQKMPLDELRSKLPKKAE
jgi:transcription initiation factor IIE alpha subunit